MVYGPQLAKPAMEGGAPAPLPSGGIQNQQLQQRAQAGVPFQGMYNGNPRGAANMPRNNNTNPFGFRGQGMAPAWSQQTNLGRYVPPTMTQFGGGWGGYNSNNWNDRGGYDYNLPGSYGSPLGQGQFAPMPQQFQQFLMGRMGGGFGGMGGGFGFGTDRYGQGGGLQGYNDFADDSRFQQLPTTPNPAPQIPSYDQPSTRNYNMAALYQMMGG